MYLYSINKEKKQTQSLLYCIKKINFPPLDSEGKKCFS